MNKPRRELIRLLREYLEQGNAERVRGRLRGKQFYRDKCLSKVREYLSLIRLTQIEPRPWRRSVQDSLTAELRQTAESIRGDCNVRLKAIQNLMLLAGYQIEVEPDATTALIKSMVGVSAPSPSVETPASVDPIEIALRRWKQEQEEG